MILLHILFSKKTSSNLIIFISGYIPVSRSGPQPSSSHTPPPAFILVCGMPGSGKSHTAQKLKKLLGYQCIIIDEIRHCILKIAHLSREEQTQRIFEYLQTCLHTYGEKKEGVIIDAVFIKDHQRQMVIRTAQQRGLSWHIIHVVCRDESLIKHRLATRVKDDHQQFSSAQRDDYQRILPNREPLTMHHDVLVNEGSESDLDTHLQHLLSSWQPDQTT